MVYRDTQKLGQSTKVLTAGHTFDPEHPVAKAS